jgi:hypothetical protein
MCLWYNNLDVRLAPVALCACTWVFLLCCIFACFCRAHLCALLSSGDSVRLRVLSDLFSKKFCAAFEWETLSPVSRVNVFRNVTFLFVSPMRMRPGIFRCSWFISRFVLCFGGLAWPLAFCGLRFFKNDLSYASMIFCLASCLLGASFLLKWLRLHFRGICLAPWLSGASFLLKWLRLRFYDFCLAPCL